MEEGRAVYLGPGKDNNKLLKMLNNSSRLGLEGQLDAQSKGVNTGGDPVHRQPVPVDQKRYEVDGDCRRPGVACTPLGA